MKKILICGKDSFIGKAFIESMSNRFFIDELDLRNENWRSFDLSEYDVIIHLAAIVHRPAVTDEKLYSQVNCDLPIEVAEKAINQGVKHFIFFSTMGVYGIGPTLSGGGRISVNSDYKPISLYGISKFHAEIGLIRLQNKTNFVLSIVRPPNVYGENCPGNYFRFMQFCAKYLFVFPLLRHNQFSMISIEQLCHVVQEIIKNSTNGIICPQDKGTQSNALRIKNMAKIYGRIHFQSKLFGKVLALVFKIYPFRQITNLFGDLYYDETLSMSVPFEYFSFYSNSKE